jgi:thiosulfate/3-mercaptopyruvate sulfurtransferase
MTPGSLLALTAKPCASEVRIVEVGWGDRDEFEQAHIPGARYVDTTEIERPPLWNRIADEELLRVLLAKGIRHDTTVIVYGRAPLPPARLAHLLIYAGVRDVRWLEGGFAAWQRAGLATESGTQGGGLEWSRRTLARSGGPVCREVRETHLAASRVVG